MKSVVMLEETGIVELSDDVPEVLPMLPLVDSDVEPEDEPELGDGSVGVEEAAVRSEVTGSASLSRAKSSVQEGNNTAAVRSGARMGTGVYETADIDGHYRAYAVKYRANPHRRAPFARRPNLLLEYTSAVNRGYSTAQVAHGGDDLAPDVVGAARSSGVLRARGAVAA